MSAKECPFCGESTKILPDHLWKCEKAPRDLEGQETA